MAVNTITFGGVNSADYGIYISGEGVFNAPVRDAEMISIPGRDGSFLLDNGRYENIEVTYPAFNTETDKATFIAQVDAFRNVIASQKGYQRLEDTFHTDEYRMASFIGGLEINPVLYNDHTSQFEIVFNCKPQRFLKSGESAVAKANNSTITNPTLFDAHPLISFNASADGTITIGDKPLNFYNKPLGVIPLPYVVYNYRPTGNYYCLDLVTFDENTPHNTGDAFTFVGAKATLTIQSETEISSVAFVTGQALRYIPGGGVSVNTATITLEDWQASSFVFGTAKTVTKSVEWRIVVAGSSTAQTQTITLELIYGGANTVRVRWSATLTSGMTISSGSSSANYVANVDSTANSLTGDLYIDLDIGEAYRIENGGVVSINNFVNLGGELPTLPPGNTTITYDNTISNFKITPRWWKI